MKSLIFSLSVLFFAIPFFGTAQSTTLALEIDGGNVIVDVPMSQPGREGSAPFRELQFINISQFAAHLKFPNYGKPGYQLYFAVGMKIGNQQGYISYNGQIVRGVFLIADLLDQGEKAKPGEIGKSFARGKLICLGIYPNGTEFKYPPNGTAGSPGN